MPQLSWGCSNVRSLLLSLKLASNLSSFNPIDVETNLANQLMVGSYPYVEILDVVANGPNNVYTVVGIKTTSESMYTATLGRLQAKLADNSIQVGYPLLQSSFVTSDRAY